jgi:AP2-associated kinase
VPRNILLKGKKFKIWDFGSASVNILDPSRSDNNTVEKEMEKYEKYTTFMYRPPEMIDKYKEWTVGVKVDIWMLGCVLFALCFFKHPFQDAQKLAILNAHYFFPTDNEARRRISDKMRDFIRHMLTPNPEMRPDIYEIEETLNSWHDLETIEINPDAQKLKEEYYRKMKRKSGCAHWMINHILSKWYLYKILLYCAKNYVVSKILSFLIPKYY